MELEIREETYLYVWEINLSEFIAQEYGRPFKWQQQNMLGQDTVIFGEVPDEEAYSESLQEWLETPLPDENDPRGKMNFERDATVDLYAILNDLHSKGRIPAGKYLIHVWW